MAIKTYVIAHGTITKGGPQGVGAELELDEKEAKKMDNSIDASGSGRCLVLKSAYDAKLAGEKAMKDALAKSQKDEAARLEKEAHGEKKGGGK